MTRALRLLLQGEVHASLRMHPLAVPVALSCGAFMACTVWVTFKLGTPVRTLETRLGRAALGALVVVYAAAFIVWGLRWFGFLGGPVPVY